eukprot:CAMPEP_0172652946 /NCGR_PEP_ID=MMETSP1068-20121228/243575_1 /TAXON_ID=35684 /ORGANISM="Pseudopedinella elastica, Strain CCMP716" /LENGTH=535 /DNA_ID=CAMNT_0013467369 /DNA_START=24 /DNA_END=1631 /DNA_ORIENTATION=-
MESWFTELDATLTSTLNTVLSEVMARDLVYDKYKPNPGVVDVKRLLQYSTSLRGAMSSRMSLEFDPPNFPRLFVDPHLLHCIYRNAVSNAFKYGSPDGQVRTIFHYDLKTSKLKLEVINDPGPAHADLVRLDPHAVAADVFGAGTRLHTGDAQGYAYLSSGDGGWIMSKVAQSLGGSVDIVFEEARTVLTLECPVHTALGHKRSAQGLLDESILEDWSVPANVWGIAVDDSSMQRLLLTELLEMAGIHPSRMVVTGGTMQECTEFAVRTEALIRAHPEDEFLVIVDENLDVICENGVDRVTISGSMEVAKLLSNLRDPGRGRRRGRAADPPGSLESRVLTLVRSANDSVDDVALYNERAHGFLPKTPLRRENIIEVLAPLWLARFDRAESPISPPAPATNLQEANEPSSEAAANRGALRPHQQPPSKRARRAKPLCDSVVNLIQESLAQVEMQASALYYEAASSSSEDPAQKQWSHIWRAVHRLKGDLLCISDARAVGAAVAHLEAMRGPTRPLDFEARWATAKSIISTLTAKGS